jgi:hypothetical protein
MDQKDFGIYPWTRWKKPSASTTIPLTLNLLEANTATAKKGRFNHTKGKIESLLRNKRPADEKHDTGCAMVAKRAQNENEET